MIKSILILLFLFGGCKTTKNMDSKYSVYVSLMEAERRIEILEINKSKKAFKFWCHHKGAVQYLDLIPEFPINGQYDQRNNKIHFNADVKDLDNFRFILSEGNIIILDKFKILMCKDALRYWKLHQKFNINYSVLINISNLGLSDDLQNWLNELSNLKSDLIGISPGIMEILYSGSTPKELKRFVDINSKEEVREILKAK